jgi:hypothetical protein
VEGRRYEISLVENNTRGKGLCKKMYLVHVSTLSLPERVRGLQKNGEAKWAINFRRLGSKFREYTRGQPMIHVTPLNACFVSLSSSEFVNLARDLAQDMHMTHNTEKYAVSWKTHLLWVHEYEL